MSRIFENKSYKAAETSFALTANAVVLITLFLYSPHHRFASKSLSYKCSIDGLGPKRHDQDFYLWRLSGKLNAGLFSSRAPALLWLRKQEAESETFWAPFPISLRATQLRSVILIGVRNIILPKASIAKIKVWKPQHC